MVLSCGALKITMTTDARAFSAYLNDIFEKQQGEAL